MDTSHNKAQHNQELLCGKYLTLVERIILLHILGATDGNVIPVRGHGNIILCKIVDRTIGLMC
jgi:hypothetical protein